MARQVASYNLLAIPVVDEENKLVGVITVDDVIDVIKDEATEDIYRLAGVSGDERVVHAGGGVAAQAAAVAGRQPRHGVPGGRRRGAVRRDHRQVVTALAIFMPIVAGMGGNAATQTLTVIVRGIALGELTWSNSRKALLKEALVGIGNGVAARRGRGRWSSWAAQGDPVLGLAAGRGDGHQHVRRRDGRHARAARACAALNIDPALASSVFITTMTDVFGFCVVSGAGDGVPAATCREAQD